VRSRVVAVTAFALLLVGFVIDALTPQTLVIAILLDVPIVLAALTQSRRLTGWLVVLAVAADALAAFIDAARDSYHWDPIGIGNRFLSMLSIVLVGYLSTEVQERAQRVGRLAGQEARARREAALSAAADRIRSSLSLAVVARAIVREAPPLLDGTAAYWYPTRGGEVLAQRDGASEVDVLDERPSSEIASLMQRVMEDGRVTVVRAVDPVGRFVLDRLAARSALALPFVDRGFSYGMLIVAGDEDAPDDGVVAAAAPYASIGVNALAQARLFDELADRNQELGERQAVIHDLVYAISHDLRTPLAALSMTLRQAVDGAYGSLPTPYTSVLRESLVSIDDLQRLTETLLLVARFESGERRVERELVDLGALASDVGAEMRALAETRGITLRVVLAEDARTRGSRADLRRAIANLVANALQHTPQAGTVELRVVPVGSVVDVVIADDGYGVDRQVRGRLFERFTGSPAGGGTGLGLYIARRIAEESGGAVRYEPRRPRGSVFTLSLPKVAA
jgi:signal transduction histidine kinase